MYGLGFTQLVEQLPGMARWLLSGAWAISNSLAPVVIIGGVAASKGAAPGSVRTPKAQPGPEPAAAPETTLEAILAFYRQNATATQTAAARAANISRQRVKQLLVKAERQGRAQLTRNEKGTIVDVAVGD